MLIRWRAALLLVLVAGGCGDRKFTSPPVATPPGQPVSKTSVEVHSTRLRFASRLGPAIDFTYHNGEDSDYYAILEALGGGSAAADFDLDGWWDICLPGGGDMLPQNELRPQPTRMWRNFGNWRFRENESPLPASPFFSHGAFTADHNHDGFPDLLITGYGGVQLLENQGDGTFRDVTSRSGLHNPLWATAAAWGDLDGDGGLDLYIGNYVDWSFENNPTCLTRPELQRDTCPPRSFQGLTDAVFRSRGDGTFENVHQTWGFSPEGKALGVLLADLDLDRDLDVYVANDGVPNFIYRNDGGRFTDISVISGADRNERGLPDGSMGLEAGDFNGDLLPDLWVSNYEQESMALYRAHPGGFFQHVSQPMGIAGIGPVYVGWGMQLSDYDGDGDEDLVIATGHAVRHSKTAPRDQQPILLENDAGKWFRNVAKDAGAYFAASHQGRGVSGCDFDNDGRCDLLVTHLQGPPATLENVAPQPARWIGLRLIGRTGPRDPIGARVVLRTDKTQQLRLVKGGGSYLSTSDSRLLFALPSAAAEATIEITWPSGTVQELALTAGNRYQTILEPSP